MRLTKALAGAVVLAVLAMPGALADMEKAPVRGDADASYQADAGALLARARSHDPSFRLDFTFARAIVHVVALPAPPGEATRAAQAPVGPPAAPVLLATHVLGPGALALDASREAALLVTTDPAGLAMPGLPLRAPQDPARLVVHTLDPVAGALQAPPDLHRLDLGTALGTTIEGLRLDAPVHARAEGDLVAVLAQGLALTQAGALAAGPAEGGQRILLVQAQDAVVDVTASGLTAILQSPEASVHAGAGAGGEVAGRELDASHEAGLASSGDGLALQAAAGLGADLLGAAPSRQGPGGADPLAAGFAPLDARTAAAGAALGAAIALAALGIAGLAGAGKYGLFTLLAPLYARLNHDEVLRNAQREAIYRFVMEHPGANVSEVVKRFGLGWGATVYHLRVLERSHLVVPTKQGRQVCYFQNGGTWSHGQRAGISALRNANAALVARVVMERPGLQQREVCRATGLAQPTVAWHLQRLEEAGLIRADASARRRYHPLPPLAELAERGLLGLGKQPAGAPAATPA